MHNMPRYLPCSSKNCASALFTLAEYIRLEEKDEKRRDLLMQAFELKTLIILIDGIDEVRAYVVSARMFVCVCILPSDHWWSPLIALSVSSLAFPRLLGCDSHDDDRGLHPLHARSSRASRRRHLATRGRAATVRSRIDPDTRADIRATSERYRDSAAGLRCLTEKSRP